MQNDTSDQGMLLASAADGVTLAHHMKIYTSMPTFLHFHHLVGKLYSFL